MRWYDEHGPLQRGLDALRDLDKWTRARRVSCALTLLERRSPGLIDRHVRKFPLGRSRWYDSEPETWLLVNGLKYADPAVLDAVGELLDTRVAAA